MASGNPTEETFSNTHALILEARRAGETYLATQMQLAIAADQRAMTLGGILAAASTVLLGFAVAGGISGTTSALFLVVALALAAACGLAFYSARPVLIVPPGNVPANWYEDIESEIPIEDALRADLAAIQRSIESNSGLLAANGKILTWAMFVAGAAVLSAPVLAILVQAARCQ